jgi:hypothetical protein
MVSCMRHDTLTPLSNGCAPKMPRFLIVADDGTTVEGRCDRCRHWDRVTLGIGHTCRRVTGFVWNTAVVRPKYADPHASAELVTLESHACSLFQAAPE